MSKQDQTLDLTEIKKFNTQLNNVLTLENSLQVDALMVEDVVEYSENSMKWTDHKWCIDLSSDTKKVSRDNVVWDHVRFVGTEYDFKNSIPKLVIESDFNDFNIRMNEDGSQVIFYKGEWIEEVQRYEIINDPNNDFITSIRVTLIGDVEVNWDYGVERGERDNPNISFSKINYHQDPQLTAKVYNEITQSPVLQLTGKGEDDRE